MPNKKKFNFIIDLTIYPFHVMVSIGESDKKVLQRLKKYGMDYSDPNFIAYQTEHAHGRTCRFESGAMLLRLRQVPTTAEDKGRLAHEVFHLAEFLFNNIGLKHHVRCGEAYAYLIGYITEKIYSEIA